MYLKTSTKLGSSALQMVFLLSACNLMAAGQTVSVTQTTGDRSQLLESQPQTAFDNASHNTSYTLNVDSSQTFQQWDGVGAAMTDSASYVIASKLTSGQRNELMNDLFSTTGAGFGMLRMPMGATDFSADGDYNYDPYGPDADLNNFSVSHDFGSVIPLAQQARSINGSLKIWATPWSMPGWMKDSGTMNGGSLDFTYFYTFGNYFAKFLQAYNQQGLPVYAITPQNEPLVTYSGYPTLFMGPDDQATLINYSLKPALDAAGFGNVKIVTVDEDWKRNSYADVVFSRTGDSVAGAAWHCYDGDPSYQDITYNAYPNKMQWMTECTGLVGSDFGGDLKYMMHNLLIGHARHHGSGTMLWNIALDQNSGPVNGGCQNCRGVVTIDSSTSPATVTKNVEYYALAHVGRFVQPGAVAIATDSTWEGGIESVGFKNPDGSIALIVSNGADYGIDFTVQSDGSSFDHYLPAASVVSFTWQP